MAYFFVTGLPRSRTGWLANFLTYGKSFCFHDGLRDCASVADLLKKMDGVSGFELVGNSDSGLGLVWPGVLRKFSPETKTVFVWRDVTDAYYSFVEYFTQHPYGMQTSLKGVRPMFDSLLEELRTWRRFANAIDVEYAELESPDAANRIWEFISDEPFNRQRWETLHEIRMNPASEKITLHPEHVRTLWHDCLVESGAA